MTRRLGVAEAVADGDGFASRALLSLPWRVVDTSTVGVERDSPEQARYRLLEALRQYGAERLCKRSSAYDIHRQHAAYFLGVAERTEPDFSSPRVKVAQSRIEAEHDNVRASLGGR